MLASLIGLLVFAAMGGALIWQPQLLTRLIGQELTTPEARNEVRAVYGGVGIGAALAFFIGIVYSPWRQAIAVTIGLMLIAMAGARGYSWYIERTTNPLVYAFLGAEAVLGLMFVFFNG